MNINQKFWFICRENKTNHTIEFLADAEDNFYLEGGTGYATKAEAQMRVDRYKGDLSCIFIQGPNFGRYRVETRKQEYKKSLNTHLARLRIIEKTMQQDLENQQIHLEKLRQDIRDLAYANGLWGFSGLPKMREFISLAREYNVFSDTELRKFIYERE